jgi:hypothetical protein
LRKNPQAFRLEFALECNPPIHARDKSFAAQKIATARTSLCREREV